MANQEANAALSAAVNDAVATELVGTKKFWQSKTFWSNVVLAGAIIVQTQTGFILSPDIQALIITGINIGLRRLTKDSVTLW
jgi:uncharacterized membrane protein